MNKLFFLACLFTLGVFVTSCEDDGDENAPIVNITSPTGGTTYAAGDTVNFSVTVTEDEALKTIELSSELLPTQTYTTFDSPTSHTEDLGIILNAATPAGTYGITITATDESDNQGEGSVELIVQ